MQCVSHAHALPGWQGAGLTGASGPGMRGGLQAAAAGHHPPHPKMHSSGAHRFSCASSLLCIFPPAQFSTALFVAYKPGGGRQQGAAGGSGQQKTGAGRARAAGGSGDDPYSALLIQPGSELPDRGTCKHYRWIGNACFALVGV